MHLSVCVCVVIYKTNMDVLLSPANLVSTVAYTYDS